MVRFHLAHANRAAIGAQRAQFLKDNTCCIWCDFCAEHHIDSLLQAVADPIPYLQIFAQWYRDGRLAKNGQPVRARTVISCKVEHSPSSQPSESLLQGSSLPSRNRFSTSLLVFPGQQSNAVSSTPSVLSFAQYRLLQPLVQMTTRNTLTKHSIGLNLYHRSQGHPPASLRYRSNQTLSCSSLQLTRTASTPPPPVMSDVEASPSPDPTVRGLSLLSEGK